MDIVRYRGVSKPQVSKSVFELMQKNYLAAQKSERDRRYTNLSITREAEQAVVALQNAQKRFIGIIESELTARERAAISAAAAKLNHSLEKYLKE